MTARPPGDPPARAAGPASLADGALAFAETDAGKRALSRAAEKAAAAEDLAGEVLAGRYRLLRLIGRGGMGAVYLAKHTLIDKDVAIKVLGYEHSQRTQDIERFLLEARAASKIRHEHIVDITDFGYTDDGLAFLVMEYLEGEDLSTTCSREGRLAWPRVLAITRQLCAALDAAHGGGIIHRDMKLENCFRIERGDNPDFIKVLDFGIAKILDETAEERPQAMTQSALVGTPEYVAPELVRGLKADARADIYAVGVIMYKLLTGEVPLRGESYMATLTKHLLERPLPPRRRLPSVAIPEAVDTIVMRALEKEPERRFQSVKELAAAIDAITSVGLSPATPRHRGLLWAGVAALVLLAVLVPLGIYLSGAEEREGSPPPTELAATERAASPPEEAAPRVGAGAPSSDLPTDGASVDDRSGDEPEDPDPTPDPDPEKAAEDPVGAPPEVVNKPAANRLSTREISRGLGQISGDLERCTKRFALPGMKVKVRLRIGSSGRVLSADPLGSHSGTSLGACVARAIRRATFPKKRTETAVTRTFTL